MTKDENFNIRKATSADLAFVRTLLVNSALPNSDVDDSGRIQFLIADDKDEHPVACVGLGHMAAKRFFGRWRYLQR